MFLLPQSPASSKISDHPSTSERLWVLGTWQMVLQKQTDLEEATGGLLPITPVR